MTDEKIIEMNNRSAHACRRLNGRPSDMQTASQRSSEQSAVGNAACGCTTATDSTVISTVHGGNIYYAQSVACWRACVWAGEVIDSLAESRSRVVIQRRALRAPASGDASASLLLRQP